MRFLRALTLPALSVLLLLQSPLPAQAQPVDIVPPARFRIAVDGDSLAVPILANVSIDEPHPERTRAVLYSPNGTREVVEAGLLYNEAATLAGVQSRTIIAGLQYLFEVDIEAHELADDVAFWKHIYWYSGGMSDSTENNPRPVRASTFTFMDSLVYRVAVNNPQLETIVVVGASAGGKYVQRYGAGTPMPELLAEIDGPPMILITVNNGSFVYLSGHRPDLQENFVRPGRLWQENAPKFNWYPYGLEELNEYMAASGAHLIRERYPSRYFFYIAGGLDNQLNAANQPEALQGTSNLLRNTFFYRYLEFAYGDVERHHLLVHEGVDHDGHELIMDERTWEPLFYYVPGTQADRHNKYDEPRGSGDPDPVIAIGATPNPFNPTTSVTLTLGRRSELAVRVFNVEGRQVAELADGSFNPGAHTFVLDGSHLASGVYFVRATAPGVDDVSLKLTLLK